MPVILENFTLQGMPTQLSQNVFNFDLIRKNL
jgi:hypothetical protein